MPGWRQDRAVTVGTTDYAGYDSSMTIGMLWPVYADTQELFLCPSTENELSFSNIEAPADPLDPSYTGRVLNFDGDPNTDEWRIESEITEGNDCDYLIDPRVPVNSRSGRVVYGDGPDLARIRELMGVNYRATDDANHGYGSVLLYFDGHADFLRMSDNGVLPNDEIVEGPSDVYVDEDVYADGDHDGDGYYDDEDKEDCDLGNHINFHVSSTTPNSNCYWPGPHTASITWSSAGYASLSSNVATYSDYDPIQ
jgi:hypothetical protein